LKLEFKAFSDIVPKCSVEFRVLLWKHVLAADDDVTYTVDECKVTETAEDDADYAYTWTADIDPATDDSTWMGCYHDFIYDFTIDDSTLTAPDDGTASDTDADIYYYAEPADGTDEDDVSFTELSDDDVQALVDVLAAESGDDFDDLAGGNLSEGDSVTTSSDDGDETTNAAGFTLYAVWDGTTDTLTIGGETNNAIVAGASFAVAAVAGLLFWAPAWLALR